jgi:dethiobiotin synthetase
MSKLFITGIDTDIGKSYVCGALANMLFERGIKVYTQKLVETGCEAGISKDLLQHQEMVGKVFNQAEPSLHCPYTFEFSASPHLSAQLEKTEINVDYLAQQMNTLSQHCEQLLVEGAGGLYVPLNKEYTIADFIVDNHLPIVLVTSARLGSINHTVLSLEFCRQRNIEVRAIVYNHHSDSNDEISKSTQKTLQSYLYKKMPKVMWLELNEGETTINVSDEQLKGFLK